MTAKKKRFPKGWNERRVRRVLSHYEAQSEEDQAVEDEAAFAGHKRTVVQVPAKLMPLIRQIIAQHGPSKP